MKYTTLASAIVLALASTGALACGGPSQPPCESFTGTVTNVINITGGGGTSVLQDGVGTSSADFTTTAGGWVDGSTSQTVTEDPNAASVETNAIIDGYAYSTTTGTVTGNATGSNYSNVNVSGSAGTDGSATFDNGYGTGTADAGSYVTGGASAGSAVVLGPNDPGVTTTGTSFQEAGFHADNTSISSVSAVPGDDYCEVPSEVDLYVSTGGTTSSWADGSLTGDGALGGSGSYAAQGGYANADVTASNDYHTVDMTASVGNNATFNGEPVQSFSTASNTTGTEYSSSGSDSLAYVDSSVDVYDGACCGNPRIEDPVTDGKSTSGTVYEGTGVAGGGVTVNFETTATQTVEGTGGSTDSGVDPSLYTGDALYLYNKGLYYQGKAEEAYAEGDMSKYEEYMGKADEKFQAAEDAYLASL